ncbi:MAG: hypothetical protein KF893_18685 [Caldilineaceae bacterium]|nr:hypothetical protein [Caldilineaceae bacterium]
MSTVLDRLRSPSITNEPPTVQEQQRNDLYVIATIVIAILLGWLVRNSTANAVRQYTFEGGAPAITLPADWIISRTQEGLLLRATDPRSPSTFNGLVEVSARPLREGEDLTVLNVSWPLKRSQELDRFRTLSSRAMIAPNGEPAQLITYAYIADPTRESGTLGMPVVVRGQDLIMMVGEGADRQLVVITTAADATDWTREAPVFERLYNRLGVREH